MIKYKLFDKTNLKGIAIAGALSLSAAFMAVPSACVYADTPVQSQTADTDSSEPLSENESEKDNPAAGDIGDTPGYNLEKTKKQSVEENENSTRQDSEIDLSARPYPAADNVINSDSYYNLGALTNYEQYINMSFDVAENDVTRLQVIYSGNSPEFAFFNPEKQIYAGSNKTYENGFSIVKKTRSDYMSIGQSKENGYKDVRRHPLCVVIGTMNVGTAGSKPLNAAFANRFRQTYTLNDPTRDSLIEVLEAGTSLSKKACTWVYDVYTNIITLLSDPDTDCECDRNDVIAGLSLRTCMGTLENMEEGDDCFDAVDDTMIGSIARQDLALAREISTTIRNSVRPLKI